MFASLKDLELQISQNTKSTGNTELMVDIILYEGSNVKKILKKDKTMVNKQNNKGWTALMIICRNSSKFKNYEEIIKLLLEYGADPNVRDNIGWTALMLASRNSNIDSTEGTVKILLEYGADPNIKDNNGWTALMMSSRYSNTESTEGTVKLILEYRADPNIKNDDGWTSLMLASRSLNMDSTEGTVRLLLRYIYDINNEIKDDNFKNDEFIKLFTISHKLNTELKEELYLELEKKDHDPNPGKQFIKDFQDQYIMDHGEIDENYEDSFLTSYIALLKEKKPYMIDYTKSKN